MGRFSNVFYSEATAEASSQSRDACAASSMEAGSGSAVPVQGSVAVPAGIWPTASARSIRAGESVQLKTPTRVSATPVALHGAGSEIIPS